MPVKLETRIPLPAEIKKRYETPPSPVAEILPPYQQYHPRRDYYYQRRKKEMKVLSSVIVLARSVAAGIADAFKKNLPPRFCLLLPLPLLRLLSSISSTRTNNKIIFVVVVGAGRWQ